MGIEFAAHFPARELALPGGRTLLVREVEESDAEAIAALYESLGEDDLYFRFFQCHTPPRSTTDKMVSVRERGGFRVVAELEDGGGTRRLVGECGYEPLPNGDGELAITVAREARGWLGPYLLDALMRVASELGTTGLEADVLMENRRMLALVRARGYATMDHSTCPGIVRVLMGTAQRVPVWPQRGGHPRVLVEAEGGRWHREAAARAAGLDVLVCPGPLSKWSHCPALDRRSCPLADGADLVVDAIPPGSEEADVLLDSHDRLHSHVPLCREVRPGDAAGTDSHPVVTQDMDDDSVFETLRRLALGDSCPPAARGNS